MAQKPETRLQRKIRDELEREIGGFWFKSAGGPFQRRGLPDLIGCVNGLFIGLEVKRPGDRRGPTALQSETGQRITDNGGCFAVVNSAEAALKVVRQCLKSSKPNRGHRRRKRLRLR